MNWLDRKTVAVLRILRDDVREYVHTDPSHALYPNHRADEYLRERLEEVLHESE